MKVISLPVLGVFLIASLSTTAMAGPTLKGAMVAPEPTMLADIQVMQREPLGPDVIDDDIKERIYDFLVRTCNEMGGGVSSDPDTPDHISCYSEDGEKLD